MKKRREKKEQCNKHKIDGKKGWQGKKKRKHQNEDGCKIRKTKMSRKGMRREYAWIVFSTLWYLTTKILIG